MLLIRGRYAAETLRDRRQTARYPIQQELQYKLADEKRVDIGAGRTINIGRTGILFTTEQSLPVGRVVEVAVNWPAMLDGGCRLKFVAAGPIVRSERHLAAMQIKRYEFRTRSARPNSDAYPSAIGDERRS